MENRNFRNKRNEGSFPFGAVVEGADYLMDMKRGSERNRKVRVNYEDTRWDSSYSSFWGNLDKYCESKFVEEEEDDPTYMMFFDNLKEHGNAYMIDVSIEHGVLSPIIYEDESCSWDWVEETCRCTSTGEEGNFDVDNFVSKGGDDLSDVIKGRSQRVGNSDVRKDSGFVNGDASYSSSVKRNRFDRSDCPNMSARRSPVFHQRSKNRCFNVGRGEKRRNTATIRKNVQKVDETYKSFFDGLHIVGESVFCEFPGHAPVYYEGGDELLLSDTVIGVAEAKTPVVETRNKPSATSISGTPTPAPNPTANPTLRTLDPPSKLSSAKPATSATPLTTSANAPKSSQIPQNAYKAPVANKKPPRPSSGAKIASERPPTSAVLSAKLANHRAFNSTPRTRVHPDNLSWFWKELHEILRKPYDQEELDDLRKELNWKSPQKHHRESRAGGTFKEGRMGKSLLDQYPDAKCAVKKAEKAQSDSRKLLNLMRMISFYITMIPRGADIPKPWKDEKTNKIMPESHCT